MSHITPTQARMCQIPTGEIETELGLDSMDKYIARRQLRLGRAQGGIGYAGQAGAGDAREVRPRRGREARGLQSAWTCQLHAL